MLSRSRRAILAAIIVACLTAACGTASDRSNPGGPDAVKGGNPPQGQSAGTGGGVAARETAGAAGAPIPTPGQTGPSGGVTSASPSPSPSPAAR